MDLLFKYLKLILFLTQVDCDRNKRSACTTEHNIRQEVGNKTSYTSKPKKSLPWGNLLKSKLFASKSSKNNKHKLRNLGALTLLALISSLLFPTSAKAVTTTLNFSDTAPTLVSGTALSQGAVYRFKNIASGVDALVTIATVSNATLTNLDDNATFVNRFQPVINHISPVNTTSYIRFNFQLVIAGTTTPTSVTNVYFSAQDVDGGGANIIREFVEVIGAQATYIPTPTLLQVMTTNLPVAGGIGYEQISAANTQAGIGIDDQYELYSYIGNSVSSFTIIGGNINGSTGCSGTTCPRQNSWTFDVADVQRLDFGDAPSTYGDAYHAVPPTPTVYLGTTPIVDGDDGPNYSATANGDDTTGTDDENGVATFPALTQTSTTYSVTAVCTGANAGVSAWIDFNRNGTFDTGERNSNTAVCTNNSVTLNWTGLSGLSAGATFARLRIASTAAQISTSTGIASNGEVEDHPLAIAAVPGTISGSLYRDANNDNTFTTGETKLPADIDVELLNSAGTVIATVQTNATGDYTFTNVTVGTGYQVRVVTSDPQIPTGFVIGTTNPITAINVTAGATVANQNFGFRTSDLTITKTHTGNFTQGLPGTYTIAATNSGGAATSGTVTVSDTLPTGLTPTLATGIGWNCTIAGQTVTCTRSDALAAGTSYPAITLTTVVASNAPASLTNTATIAGGGQTNTTNDSASDPTTITAVSDLTIAKTHTGNFTRGSTGNYSIVVTNSGSIATNGTVTVNDTLPTGLTLNGTPSGTGWVCTATSTTAFSCTRLDILNAGSSYPAITATVNVAQNAANSVTNTATVSGVGEANTNNNSASDPTNIVSSADLGITKTDNQTATTAGNSISYTITVTNNGPSTLNSVTVTDTVPSTIQNPTFTPSTGGYNSSTGVWTGLNLVTGQSVTLTMTGTVSSTAAGTITNTATVAVPSGVTDPTAGNNTATDTTNVYAVAPTAGRVIINEVLYAQTGATAATNDEFIEIYNASNASVDLSGWRLADGNLIENSTDGSGSITGSSVNPAYLFPNGTTLAPGQYAVIWVGSNTTTNQASGATFQAWLGQPAGLNNTGDDVWLYDSQSRIVDYIAYGSGSAINTPPPTSLNLWNTTYQTSLAGASTGQSISLTANGIDGNASACWEPTTSGQASTRCTSYLPTRDTDNVGIRVTTVGQNNNGALAPLMLLVKRITAINGSTTNLTGFIDDPNTTNDNSNEWPAPASGYLKGAINGGAIKPGDTVEYTIYFLSNGGSSAQKVNMCDLVPTNTTFVPDAFGNGLGIAQASGSAAAVNLTNTADTDGGLYINANASLPTGVNCGASNTNGAVIVNLGNVPNATSAGTPTNSYGFIRFRVKVN